LIYRDELTGPFCVSQEDESVLAERKMKQEEEVVDILGGKDAGEEIVDHPRGNGDEDDFSWADDEPDEDIRGWRMKIVMEDELDVM
jgi:COMPASS component SWD1